MTTPTPDLDPIAGLLLPAPRGPAVPLRYRSGRLVTWDPTTGENTVLIDGETFEDVPMIPGSWLSVLHDGDTVAMISTTDESGLSTYAMIGVPITPPDPRIGPASRAAGYIRQVKGVNTLSTSTTSGSYTAIVGTVESRMFKISDDSAVEIDMSGSCFSAFDVGAVAFGVQVDGGDIYDVFRNELANGMLSSHTPWAGGNIVTGLTAGEHTFQPMWARTAGGGTLFMNDGDQLLLTVREVL